MSELLQLTDVSFVEQSNGRLIIDKINLSINQGEFVILLGANGCGKSTLFKLINRDLLATTGCIKFDGQTQSCISSKDHSKLVAVLSQSPNEHLCLSMTIAEHFKLYQLDFATPIKIKQALAAYLEPFHKMFTTALDTPVRHFSGGEKQLLVLALVILRKPKLLLLDEHTSALDPKTSLEIMKKTQQLVQQHHVTCIMTTHNLEQASQYGERIVVMRAGKVIREYNQTPLSSEMLLENCYG